MKNLRMVTEDQLTVIAVLLQEWLTVHLNTKTCTEKQIVEIFFYLFSIHLPFYSKIKDPIRGECPRICFGLKEPCIISVSSSMHVQIKQIILSTTMII